MARVGGRVDVNQVGTLPGFGEVYDHDDSIDNLLSFFDMAKKYKIIYNWIKTIFEVEINTKTIQFKEVNDAVVLDTIESTERLFAERSRTGKWGKTISKTIRVS